MLKDIKKNRIVAIISESNDLRSDFNKKIIKKYKIKELKISSEKISDIFNSYKDLDILFELAKNIGLKKDVFNRNINMISESELHRINLLYQLLQDDEFLLIDDLFDILDNKNRTKLFKYVLKLKKYNNKTIFISTSNINNVYEIVDDIIYVNENDIIYDNKYDIYEKNDIKEKPEIINFVNMMKEKYPHISYKDSINELIKELYRELR